MGTLSKQDVWIESQGKEIKGALDDFIKENKANIVNFAEILATKIKAGGTVYVCGNGGSASQAQHFAAELVGKLAKYRQSYPAIALTADSAALTAISNDFGYADVFRRQIEGLCKSWDVLVVISTSGNSENIVRAAEYARKTKGMTVLGILGNYGGIVKDLVEHSIVVYGAGSQQTQEIHLWAIHILCGLIEDILEKKE
jgi:D-sedoheptulose 7-phosphate isomerase